MTHQSSRAYACVAYRIMEYEGQEMSESFTLLLVFRFILYSAYKLLPPIGGGFMVFPSFPII